MNNKAKYLFIALMIIVFGMFGFAACGSHDEAATSEEATTDVTTETNTNTNTTDSNQRHEITVTFEANGHGETREGETSYSQKYDSGYDVLLPHDFVQRTEHRLYFQGWAESANGEPKYFDGAPISYDSDTTLYAIWGESPTTSWNSSADNGSDASPNANADTSAISDNNSQTDQDDDTRATSGFTLGKDNNSFRNDPADFWRLDDHGHVIPDDPENPRATVLDYNWYKRLTAHASDGVEGEIMDVIDDKIDDPTGLCYGLSATMGLLYNGQISIDQLTKNAGIHSYFDLPRPVDDAELRNIIVYYHLSQFLDGGGSLWAARYHYTDWLTNEHLPEALRQIVAAAKSDEVTILQYSTWTFNHFILIVGYREGYNGEHIVELYDNNSISSSQNGDFSDMVISKDFKTFTFPRGDGVDVTHHNCMFLKVIDVDNIIGIDGSIPDRFSEEDAAAESVAHISVKDGRKSTITFDGNKKITIDGKRISGGEYIKWITPIASGEGDDELILTVDDSIKSIQVTTPDSDSMDVSFYNDDGGVYLEGKNIDEADLSVEDGIDLKGKDFTYEASLTTKEKLPDNEVVLASVSAHSSTDTSITNPKDGIIDVSSEGQIDQLSASKSTGVEMQEIDVPSSGDNISFNATDEETQKGKIKGVFYRLMKKIIEIITKERASAEQFI